MPTKTDVLRIKLTSEGARQVQSDLGKTRKSLGTIEQSTTTLEAGLKRLGPIMTATFATVAIDRFVDATKRAVEQFDEIAKTADKIGLTTDALQELRFAAERTGLSSDTLDMAMQRFSRRVGEAAQGTGELTKTLDQYGIEVKDAAGNMRPLEAILNDYANTIATAGSEQEQLRLAFKAFDSEGASLVNTLRNGAQGLDELRQSAKQSGYVIEESLLRKAEAINDRWNVLVDTIGNKFKSALVTAADAALNFFGIYNDLESATNALADAQLRLVDALDRAENARGRNLEAARRAADQAQNDIADIQEQIDAYRRMQEARDRLSGLQPVDIGETSTQPTATLETARPGADEDAHVQAFERYQQYLADRVEATRVSLLSETEAENERFQQAYDDLIAAQELGIETKKSYWELEQELLSEHTDKLNEITERGLSARERFNAISYDNQAKQVFGTLAQITQGVAQHNRTMFEINKVAAIATATINTYQGVTQALAAYPPPVSFVLAAAQLAAGLAQVSAISSTSFGGGGAAPSLSGTGATGTVATVPTQPALTEQQDSQQVTIQFVGDVYGLEDFEDTVIRTVQSAVSDRDSVIIRSDSRQAQELKA